MLFVTTANADQEREMRHKIKDEVSRRSVALKLKETTPEDSHHGWLPRPGIPPRKALLGIFDDPNSCKLAFVFSLWIVLLIFYSVAVFNLESMRSVHDYLPRVFFDFSEIFCVGWFTFEYVIRFSLTHRKLLFVFSPMNLIDLLAIAPFYVSLLLHTHSQGASFLRVVRLFRVFRIFKMGKYSGGMRLIGNTLIESSYTLALLVAYVAIGTVIFSSLIYFAEMGEPTTLHGEAIMAREGENHASPFSDIPTAFWWCIVTMTTVGYGDMVPITPVGKLIASVTMLCGVLVLALPINVVGGNFVEAYQIYQKKEVEELSRIRIHNLTYF
eukprot:c15545_g1_i4.p1 GENE.c15545_g1_i4~~c15545_g1_i4.p1  ORF type:complete len:327 (+),score=51.11 c15545_g1_i4:75-1055(+)